jgi:hypothetical protein
MLRDVKARLVILFAMVALAVAGCGGGGGDEPRKATCWTPEFAANPVDENGQPLAWAKNPSPTHRHGKGPRGVNVCG